MTRKILCFLMVLCAIAWQSHAARILVFFPTATFSHQVVSRYLTQELAKRGHDVIVITPDPVFTNQKAPANLTEIDVHDAAYAAKKLGFAETVTGSKDDLLEQVIECFRIFSKLFEAEIKTKQVQAIIKDKDQKFDLVILEACTKPLLVLSHIFNAPTIVFSTFGAIDMYAEYTGSAIHPLLYPSIIHQRLHNLTIWEKTYEVYKHYMLETALRDLEKKDDELLKRNFGANVPPLSELKKNIDMVFIAEHHLWDHNRPVPPNMVYLGGIYPKPSAGILPQDLKAYLDSSTNGVVYVSFGQTVLPSMLPQERVQTIFKVLSMLPYDVMLKWDTDKVQGLSKNVRVFKWLPQTDVLRHPKIKLFVTQGGLQSTDDAIAAGVPLVGIPMLGDQWYNIEQYLRFKIGLRVDIETLTEASLLTAINKVLNDDSYRRNIVSLRTVLRDQPQTAIERAIWWSEYVIRNKGARHLRAPTALISNWDYYEMNLVLVLAFWLVVFGTILILLVYGIVIGLNLRKKMKLD